MLRIQLGAMCCTLALGLLASGLLGCGAAQSSSQSATRAGDPSTASRGAQASEPQNGDHEASDPRALPAGATYGDLVSALRAAEVARSESATAPCLMTGGRVGQTAHLDAELAAAVHPIPDAPAGLGSRLSAGAVAILSRYGARGPTEPTVAVATLSAVDPPDDGEQVLIVLTSRGAMLRSTDRRVETSAPFPLDELRSHLDAFAQNPQLIALTAEASVPLSTLHDALLDLPEHLVRRLTLAVALPAGTRAPAPAAAHAERTPVCEDLPPWAPDAQEGTLPNATLLAGAGPLRQAAHECLASAGPTARTGRMVVLFRVGVDGRVEAACVGADDTGSDTLRACVLEHARAMHFPPPSPVGLVQAALPLSFRIDHGAPMHGLCISE